MRSVIYPGNFDPITNGHLDIIQRATSAFDHVVVALTQNSSKTPTFSLEKRFELIQVCTSEFKNVEIDSFQGLLVDYAKSRHIKTILRGLRAISDFEYEFMMANMNRRIADDIETVFMMTRETNFYVSSKLVHEVARLGGNVESMVPKAVSEALSHLTKASN
ncbi:MAG: pantetheine-phosphate adenylyltransferase [Myxococcaceae bacterium]|nr:pantetheine-phosphate adenylyltransferase [Myxococcaceae bacterium]MBH2006234.1 pantetheine-phosphate adenylyltransferase [Myxococcaceae bacterium]